jgi:CysZ protein
VPVAVALVLFSGLGALGIYGALRVAESIVGPNPATWGTIGGWLIVAILSVVGLLLSLLVGMALAQPISGVALDKLSRRQEEALGASAWPDQGFWESTLRSLRVTLAALVLGGALIVLLTLVEVLFPPIAVVTIPIKFVVSSLLVAWDFLDYPLSMRGIPVRARVRWVFSHFWAVCGFGMAAGMLLLVPGLALALLPIGVCGASRLVVEIDRAEGLRS